MKKDYYDAFVRLESHKDLILSCLTTEDREEARVLLDNAGFSEYEFINNIQVAEYSGLSVEDVVKTYWDVLKDLKREYGRL